MARLTAARFDAASLKVLGDPVTLVGSVSAAGLSPKGTLAYIAGKDGGDILGAGSRGRHLRATSAVRVAANVFALCHPAA